MTTPAIKKHKSHLSEAIHLIKKSMGRELRYRRERAGLAQADVAQEAGVRAETVSRIEREKENPTLSTMVEIIDALERLGA